MEVSFRVCILLCLLTGILEVQAQNSRTSQWGLGIDLLGPSIRYTTAGVEGWVEINEELWINGGFGYGERQEYEEEGVFNNGSAWRYHLSAQLFYDPVRTPYFSWFVGSGPYWMQAGDELGKGFVYNMPKGALTAHSGADYKLTKAGLQCTTGVRFLIGPVTLGTRVHLPVFYARTDFTNLQDPLLVVDFIPERIRHDQRKISGIRFSSGLSFHFGFRFGRR